MNRRLVFLKLLTCAVGGAIFLSVIVIVIITTSGDHVHVGELPSIVGTGALYGLFVGIAWAIEDKVARRRFILALVIGLVAGLIYGLTTGSGMAIVVISTAGAYIGFVLAIVRIGAFRNK